ncbi:armadillo repeat-containing protein 2 isoform X1 [Aquila chrysaetos chrysaetos]|uniref:Armadillo repeat containing 2 n=2 Tax=Aquila chrysaetos chrysaetos TaxID=223781 RepID=A0A663EDP7_AQUCH|nr:armadillo repeat-containing protein 2 isoform X1 [Aquila chrysaetos chrysaetos]XP_029889508.1 armadillo repeat-containing protein 2 isoform X1 [Aquila chrysaetos chrysaetos]XP_029889518.1 armadillo repeat-containing protein 2 isoform X1 [Aquila chrysaetos chrysaetos]
MQASKNKNTEKAEPFYRLSVPKQKTSSEIINEARNVLRTLRTRRPFTPTEDQRKLFGSRSSRAPQNRPPSVFSLHASSFDLAESRPVSGVRLSPLDHKPVLVTFAEDEDSSISLPKPPASAAEVRKVSSARARLFGRTCQGSFLSAKMVPPDQNEEKLDSEEPAMMNNLCRSNNNCLEEQRSYTPFNDESRRLICNECISKSEREDLLKGTAGKFLFQLRGERSVNSDGRFADEEQQFPCDQMKEPGINSSRPRITGWKRRVTGLEDETRINESEEEESFWHIKILPILRELEKEDNIENLCLACTKLYQALNEENMLGKRLKRRSVLLKTLYKLVDVDSDPLCLKLAKIILAMKVDGKNLLSVCKLAFKICRNEKNDYIIQNDRLLDCLLEVLRTEDLQKNNEALLYCMGAIKLMSGNAVLLNEMVNKGAVEMLLQLMKQINNIKENDTYFSNLGHLLVQLTATLRNLADLPPARHQLLCSGAVSELCAALERRVDDKDVCIYIVRIFSKLSFYNDFCAALADCSRCYVLFLALLNKYQKKQDLVIRIIFILGNLTAKNNQAREQFFKEKGSVNTLISLFQTYHELDLNAQKWYHEKEGEGKTHPKDPSEAEDVLIKLIRVLANLSIHPSVGAALAAAHRVVELLVTVLEYKSVDDCEELVINAATTINNLSYYKVKSSAVQDKKLHIAEMLLKLLMSNNMDGVVEAVRVFGNLSQYHEICDFIIQKKIYKFMIALLDAKNQDVCFSACGVLLNLTVDKNKRALLMEEGGIGKLVDCLQDFGPADWQLACLICKTLWNYSENITSAASCFGEDTDTLLVLLTSLLDEEVALDYSLDRDLRDYQKLYWEREFKPVAEKLLDRIQSHHFLPTVTITPF